MLIVVFPVVSPNRPSLQKIQPTRHYQQLFEHINSSLLHQYLFPRKNIILFSNKFSFYFPVHTFSAITFSPRSIVPTTGTDCFLCFPMKNPIHSVDFRSTLLNSDPDFVGIQRDESVPVYRAWSGWIIEDVSLALDWWTYRLLAACNRKINFWGACRIRLSIKKSILFDKIIWKTKKGIYLIKIWNRFSWKNSNWFENLAMLNVFREIKTNRMVVDRKIALPKARRVKIIFNLYRHLILNWIFIFNIRICTGWKTN